MASAAKQSWGFWTQSKLQILEDYLAAFLTASSLRAKGAVYLDAFAGEGAGRDRLTDSEFDGSARIAAAVSATNDTGATPAPPATGTDAWATPAEAPTGPTARPTDAAKAIKTPA
ncbi:MAG: hypothetical protein ACRDMJ_14105, partial [Solirubrobacteraceae bacterium]